MADDEDTIPKAGGVKAMLAALKNKGLDKTEKDNYGTVPVKKSWKPPPKVETSQNDKELDKTEKDNGSVPVKKSWMPPPKGENSEKDTAGGNEALAGDELRRVREQVAAKRGAAVNGGTAPGGPPPPPTGRGGPVAPGRGGRATHTRTHTHMHKQVQVSIWSGKVIVR